MPTDRRLLLASLGLAAAVLGQAMFGACASEGSPGNGDPGEPLRAFAEVTSVLRHPRCLNCHPVTDYPRVGDAPRRHDMNVLRGPDGLGTIAMRCGNCHQDHNQDAIGVPGAPHWKLAPLSMGWEGLDDRELAEAIKDEDKNGGRSLDDLLHHMAEDPLVGWAWAPGTGRSAPPISRDAFVQAFREWIEGGAPSPLEGTTGNLTRD